MKQRNPLVSATLVSGVLLSTALLLLGLVESLVNPQPVLTDVPKFGSILHGILTGDPVATIDAGLMVLMLTPLARVIVVTFEFLRDGEYSFALISIGVLLLLTTSLLIAFR